MLAVKRRREGRERHYEAASYLELRERLANNLKQARDARRWTQEDAAFACDEMSVSTYQRLEAGSENVTLVTLTRLADGFSVDASELLAKKRRR